MAPSLTVLEAARACPLLRRARAVAAFVDTGRPVTAKAVLRRADIPAACAATGLPDPARVVTEPPCRSLRTTVRPARRHPGTGRRDGNKSDGTGTSTGPRRSPPRRSSRSRRQPAGDRRASGGRGRRRVEGAHSTAEHDRFAARLAQQVRDRRAVWCPLDDDQALPFPGEDVTEVADDLTAVVGDERWAVIMSSVSSGCGRLGRESQSTQRALQKPRRRHEQRYVGCIEPVALPMASWRSNESRPTRGSWRGCRASAGPASPSRPSSA